MRPATGGPPENRSAAQGVSGAGNEDEAGKLQGDDLNRWPHSVDAQRTPRRQRLFRQLLACGERPAYEFVLAIAAGADFDESLVEFTRIPAEIYHALGASDLDLTPDLRVCP